MGGGGRAGEGTRFGQVNGPDCSPLLYTNSSIRAVRIHLSIFPSPRTPDTPFPPSQRCRLMLDARLDEPCRECSSRLSLHGDQPPPKTQCIVRSQISLPNKPTNRSRGYAIPGRASLASLSGDSSTCAQNPGRGGRALPHSSTPLSHTPIWDFVCAGPASFGALVLRRIFVFSK
ncbi:hypothetical protein BDZ94DRAFT_1263262, partial [Collybia nuda]